VVQFHIHAENERQEADEFPVSRSQISACANCLSVGDNRGNSILISFANVEWPIQLQKPDIAAPLPFRAACERFPSVFRRALRKSGTRSASTQEQSLCSGLVDGRAFDARIALKYS